MSTLNLVAVQRRTLWVLSTGQMLGGLGLGMAFSLGSLLTAYVGGSPIYAGLSAAMNTLGTAIFAAPLAYLAGRWGRRVALSVGASISLLGAVLVVVATATHVLGFVLVAMLLLGAGGAVNLQTRFAASDLAQSHNRARDLSLVVWATTIGIVLGPNLAAPGDAFGEAVGLPMYTGAFLFAAVAQFLAFLVYWVALKPDPLTISKHLAAERGDTQLAVKQGFGEAVRILKRRPVAVAAVLSLALTHATMVAVMAITPEHLKMHGEMITLIGLTISLHTLGMYGLAPVFGKLADKLGRKKLIVFGQLLSLLALILNWIAPSSLPVTTVALIFLGLGWSASTVAASALLTESVDVLERTPVQGFSDTVMSLSGTLAAILGGAILGVAGYAFLNVWTMLLIAAVFIALFTLGRRSTPSPTA